LYSQFLFLYVPFNLYQHKKEKLAAMIVHTQYFGKQPLLNSLV